MSDDVLNTKEPTKYNSGKWLIGFFFLLYDLLLIKSGYHGYHSIIRQGLDPWGEGISIFVMLLLEAQLLAIVFAAKSGELRGHSAIAGGGTWVISMIIMIMNVKADMNYDHALWARDWINDIVPILAFYVGISSLVIGGLSPKVQGLVRGNIADKKEEQNKAEIEINKKELLVATNAHRIKNERALKTLVIIKKNEYLTSEDAKAFAESQAEIAGERDLVEMFQNTLKPKLAAHSGDGAPAKV